MNIKLVAFDLDGTLTEGNSWRDLTRDLGAPLDVLDKNYLDILAGRVSVADAKQKVIDLWRSTGLANRQNIFEIINSWQCRPEAEAVIHSINQLGAYTIILSGAFIEYAEVVCARLGIDKALTSAAMKFDEAGELYDFDYEMQQAARKREQLIVELEQKKLTKAECIVVGDSENDIDVFKYTRRGISIGDGAHPELRTLALRHIDDLTPLPQIIESGL